MNTPAQATPNGNPTAQFVPVWRRPTVSVPLAQAFPQLGEIKEFKERVCIFNEDRSKLFNVVSPRYAIIPHGTVIDLIEEGLQAEGIRYTPTIRSLESGARLSAEFMLDSVPMVDIGRGDKSKLKIMVRNSYDGSWKFSMRLGAFRLICSNGAVIGRSFGLLSGKHFGTLSARVMQGGIQTMVNSGASLGELWSEWADTPVTHEEATELLTEKFPEKYLVPILEESRFPRSKWDLYNDCTAFSTHNTPSVFRRLEFEDKIADIFYDR